MQLNMNNFGQDENDWFTVYAGWLEDLPFTKVGDSVQRILDVEWEL